MVRQTRHAQQRKISRVYRFHTVVREALQNGGNEFGARSIRNMSGKKIAHPSSCENW